MSTRSPSFQAEPPPALPHHPLTRGSSTCFRKAWGPYERGVAAGGGIFSDLPARALVHSWILWAAPGGGYCLPPAPSWQKAVAGALQEGESLLIGRVVQISRGPQTTGLWQGTIFLKLFFVFVFYPDEQFSIFTLSWGKWNLPHILKVMELSLYPFDSPVMFLAGTNLFFV